MLAPAALPRSRAGSSAGRLGRSAVRRSGGLATPPPGTTGQAGDVTRRYGFCAGGSTNALLTESRIVSGGTVMVSFR
jgi:hypothetical protein